MTAIFKVVEFYRFNNSTNNTNNTSLNNSNINATINNIITNENDVNYDDSSSSSIDCLANTTQKKSFPTTISSSSISSNGSNSIYNTLGFNVLGGYLTDFPATITDVAASLNGKSLKVEEGDIILEINGINTRHLTLNEVYKQLRCCGSRVLLKLKSDPDYKNRFKQILLEQKTVNQGNSTNETTFNDNNNSNNRLISKNASKSYDNNINYVQYTSLNKNNTNTVETSSNHLSNSTTASSSNVSSVANSRTNILIESSPNCKKEIDLNENSTSSLVTLKLTDDLLTSTTNAKIDNTSKAIIDSTSNQQFLTSASSSSSSSPSSSSSLPVLSNDLISSSSSLSASSTAVTDLTNQVITINLNNLDSSECQQADSFQMTEQQLVNNNTNIASNTNGNINNNTPTVAPLTHTPVLTFQVEIDDSIKKKIDEKLKECSSADSDSDSEHNVYTPKAVDLPSAQRLAKRLYFLDGFKPNDVFRHLSKKNDFSQLVADEYLKLFNFQSLTLDSALRKFLKQFQLNGDAQEKERVLMYFAKRYVDANNTAFTDVDSCHTLTCAIMLLNTDLHDPKIQNKMTLPEFIENLKGLNSGSNFSDVLLESLYSAIKNEPLECAGVDGDDSFDDRNGTGIVNGNFSLRPLDSNPFLQFPDPQTAKEYKFGWLLRKCCVDSDGKKAPFLKRSWKMFYASLRDMVLYLHKDDKVFKNNTFDNITNAIRIHHAYATVATDYKKKQFVFRLKTADWAEYLFQTSNSNELYEWVSNINLVSAMFSSPPLPGGIGSNKTFQRPLLPVSKTRYTLQEQLEYHKKHLKQLHSDIAKLESIAGASNIHANNNNNLAYNFGKEERYFDKDKYNYLQFEIQRYTIYSELLEEKLAHETNSMANTALMPQYNIVNPSFCLNDTQLNGHAYHSLNGNKSYFDRGQFVNNKAANSLPLTTQPPGILIKNYNSKSPTKTNDTLVPSNSKVYNNYLD